MIYIWQLPPFEGPDEFQHFAYVEWLATGKGFPPQGDAAWQTPIEQEAGQPPLYYLIVSLPARFLDLDDPAVVYRVNPHFPAPFPRELGDNDNRAVQVANVTPLRGGWLAFYLGRIISLIFGVVLIVAVHGLAREVAPALPAVAVAAPLLVAVIPQVVFIGSVVSNDIPAAALSAVVLWLLARMLRRGPTRGGAIALGATFGLATLTKVSTFTLAFPVALGFGWLWLYGRQEVRTVATTLVYAGASAFVVGGWWYLRSWIRYGSPLGLDTHDPTPWAISDPSMLDPFSSRWLETMRSFWLAFGWGTIRPPIWVYHILLFMMLLAAMGLVVALWRRRQRGKRKIDTGTVLTLLLALAFFLVAIVLEIWMHRVKAAHGRLLFPALSALAVLLVLGWHAFHPRLPFVVAGFLAVLSLSSPLLLLRPVYTPPQLLSPAEAASVTDPLSLRFGPSPETAIAELLAVTPASQEIAVDSVLPVRVCWRALAETARDYTVLLHLIGPENRLIANRRSYPGMGHYLTSRWETGDTFCDLMHVAIEEENVPQTLRYRLEIALLDEASDERLSAYTAAGEPVPVAFVDAVTVRTAEQPPDVAVPAEAPPFALVDSEIAGDWYVGQETTITLQWRVNREVEADYQTFVHLRDLETGQNVAQADGPPMDGWYPTSWWQAGELVVDERGFPIPPELVAGRYRLVVGFYDRESGERIGPEFELGTVTVQS